MNGSPGAARSRTKVGAKPSTLVAHADEGFGYETMFLLQATGTVALDVDAIRDHLESIGESVLVAGDSRALKVHVHNERPDLVIGYGLTLGDMSRITVENLDNQAKDVRESKAAEFTGAAPVAAGRRRARHSCHSPAMPSGFQSTIAMKSSPSASPTSYTEQM